MNSQYPSDKISAYVKAVVEELYRFQWEPRVVRQQKQYSFSELSHIDYAVPCFELATLLEDGVHKNADIVSRDIVKYMEDDPKQHFTDIKKFFGIEALGGYLNFQLSEEYLQAGLELAEEWIQKPSELGDKKDDHNFLIFGFDEIFSQGHDIEMRAIYYLNSLWNLLDGTPSISYLLEDNSEKFATHCTRSLIDENLDNPVATEQLGSMYMNMNRKVKSFLSSGGQNELADRITVKRTEKIKSIVSALDALGVKDEQLISEVDIRENVDKYLDEIQHITALSNKIIRDEANKALYFVSNNIAVALRSVEGFIFHESYILFMLHEMALQAASGNESLVIVAPHRIHAEIKEYLSLLQEVARKAIDVVCFDPRVSRADIVEFEKSYPYIGNEKEVAALFHDLKEAFTKGITDRKEAVEYLSLPTELNRTMRTSQIPGIFDLLSEMSLLSVRLRSQTKVYVAAD